MDLKENITDISKEMKMKVFDIGKGKNEFLDEISGGKTLDRKEILDSPLWKNDFFVLFFVHALLSMMRISSKRLPSVTGKNIWHFNYYSFCQ